MRNCKSIGGFAFKYASINEYDITVLNYQNFYHCTGCNINTAKGFATKGEIFYGSPIISTSSRRSLNTFCLNPTDDISIFYINENKINKNFYNGKTVEYLLNNDTDIIYINNLFIVNGKENYIFDIEAVSFKIVNITNMQGKYF